MRFTMGSQKEAQYEKDTTTSGNLPRRGAAEQKQIQAHLGDKRGALGGPPRHADGPALPKSETRQADRQTEKMWIDASGYEWAKSKSM